ncbi:hypothetical protein C1637_24085 [Chryseobacterium lactis]|uniref:Uncharacterized protein n=1 Tax=Chryseobacterium lactis TaxID=1241981 RepID=A0AA92BAK3_CHRLC|nr:hypothetical protein [Chryseobacterium lactis]PNW11160.1 hypothetical protein C1637_24085 [Chryseobacterium lactis]
MRFFKIFVCIALVSIFLGVGSYLVFIYYFTKEPEPTAEYTFPNMNYKELEKRIEKIEKKDTYLDSRYVVLGKDSLKYIFITSIDENQSSKYGDKPYIELQVVLDSKSKMLNIVHKNKDDYPKELKLFEEGFIDKLKKK